MVAEVGLEKDASFATAACVAAMTPVASTASASPCMGSPRPRAADAGREEDADVGRVRVDMAHALSTRSGATASGRASVGRAAAAEDAAAGDGRYAAPPVGRKETALGVAAPRCVKKCEYGSRGWASHAAAGWGAAGAASTRWRAGSALAPRAEGADRPEDDMWRNRSWEVYPDDTASCIRAHGG